MFLDEVRLRNGANEMVTFFDLLVEHDTEEAVSFINDDNLKFATLFILRNNIEETKFYGLLNLRNKIALRLIQEMLTGENSPYTIEELRSAYVESVRTTLLWMLKTGSSDDGMNDEYDEVMDKTAILLTKVYRDRTAMETMADIIFQRNAKGLFTHDMIWAFFEAKDPLSLIIIANHMFSENVMDEKLVRQLLNFVPDINTEKHIEKEKAYTLFMTWLKNNILFLHYTGESFQHTSRPMCYKVSEQAKYLCQCACIENGDILKELTEEENKLLEEFNKLDKKTRQLLSNFSFKMHYENFDWWKHWIKRNILQQINIAKSGARK